MAGVARAILRGRRGTTLHPPSFDVAGVAHARIYRRFAWQAWHSWHWVARLGLVWAPGDAAPSCVAGVAQPHIYRRFTWQVLHKVASTVVFAWQAWHSWHWVSRLGLVWAPGDAAPSCVAGVAQPHIYRRFTWQVLHKVASTVVSRGRRGTHGTGWRAWVWFGRPVTPRHLAWQAWHNLTSTFVSRGRRGTRSHLPSFCVAGVALMALGGALGSGLGAR